MDKRYIARVDGELTAEHVAAFAAGLDLGDFTAQSAQLTILEPTLGEVIVHEGKFHQVKRMFGAVGHPVVKLKRLSVGGVPLDESLAEGESRPLTEAEVKHLRALVDMD